MDKRVKSLKTVAQCEQFAVNARKLGHPDLAQQTKLRSIEIKAFEKGPETPAEQEALQAIFAYEQVLSAQKGKATRASKAWPMISKYGIIAGVERVANRQEDEAVFTALGEMDLQDFALEAVISRYPDEFSEETVAICNRRLSEWQN